MAFISRDYYKELKDLKIIERNDWTNLARASREVGLKKGKGYTRDTFRNIVEGGNTTTQDMVDLILNYYTPKIESLKKQRESVKEMRRKLSSTL